MIAVAFDAAWGGTGWAICTERGAVAAGWWRPGSASWRMHALRGLLDEHEHRVEALARAHVDEGAPRAVIEQAPRHGNMGNEAAICWGLGEIAGAIEVWGLRPTWLYPWLVPPTHHRKGGPQGWREWWGLSGGKREAMKRDAILVVQGRGWVHHLPDREPLGAGGDVAEAILLGVGACRHKGDAPVGPQR